MTLETVVLVSQRIYETENSTEQFETGIVSILDDHLSCTGRQTQFASPYNGGGGSLSNRILGPEVSFCLPVCLSLSLFATLRGNGQRSVVVFALFFAGHVSAISRRLSKALFLPADVFTKK